MGASLSFGSWMLRHRRSHNNKTNDDHNHGGGGILVEIVGTSSCSGNKIGWEQAARCDFGANEKSAGNRHFVIQLPKGKSVPLHLYPTPGIYTGAAVFKKLIRIALCKKMESMNIEKGGDCDGLQISEWKFATWRRGIDS